MMGLKKNYHLLLHLAGDQERLPQGLGESQMSSQNGSSVF